MYEKLTIVGNVGRDAEMRYTPSGQAVTSFSLAVNNSYTSQSGEKVKETKWFRVTAWGKLAETCNEYVKKGMTVLVDGTLSADKSTGNPRVFEKKDGTWGATFEVNAQTVRFLSRSDSASDNAGDSPVENDEELPF